MTLHRTFAALGLSLGLLVAGCGDDSAEVSSGDGSTTVPDSPALTAPDRAPDITGTVTAVTPFVPVTEDCTPADELDPDDSVSSDDPPVCTDPDTDVTGTVLVEEHPGAQDGRKISFTLTSETVLLGSDGAALASFDDFQEGQVVEAWTTGACAESYPEQCGAEAVRRTA